MIIFGWGKKIRRQAGQSGPYRCKHCHNLSWWPLYVVITWFTFFFVPVIPYRKEHVMICGVCGNGIKLDKEKFKELTQRPVPKAADFR